MSKKLVIVGGVAGGASCAARARRLLEDLEIIVFEKGAYVSFANCGLPYYIGNVIKREGALLVATPKSFKDDFRIDVRIKSRVTKIDPKNKTVTVQDLKNDFIYTESYDFLVLSPGSKPFLLKGADLPGIFTIRTIPDARKVNDWISRQNVRKAVIAGGGFIGLEMAENLRRLNIDVTIIEMQSHVMPPLDPEMGAMINSHLKKDGISLLMNSRIAGFTSVQEGKVAVNIESSEPIVTDMVILALGVRPNIALAQKAGLKIGERNGIVVDSRMQTSDPNIWAVGDAVELEDFVTRTLTLVPLAGPANRQGRLVADVIFGKKERLFRGVQGTAVCGVMGLTIASTGVSEKVLKQNPQNRYEKIYVHPESNAEYYPGGASITIKLIFSVPDGKILGAQAIGVKGVEKRIDVIASAIQHHGTVFDLEDVELCYAPQYGAAKDPVNIAGMVAGNVINGYDTIQHWENIKDKDAFLLDVRLPYEFAKGHVPGAVNIPLNQLRKRLDEIPENKEIFVYCYIGRRSYIAVRLLSQKGFKAKSMSGGIRMYQVFKDISF